MIVTCRITSVGEEQTVTFQDGKSARVLRVWIAAESDSGGKEWQTFIDLWREKISAFRVSGLKEQDQVSVEIIPSYRRLENGKLRQKTEMIILDIENE